jgi:enterochelin esterase-like enzyme
VKKERKISVYVPAAYKDGTKAPLLIGFDGGPASTWPGSRSTI